MKVYVVTTSSYGSYAIESVWSTRRKAKARKAILGKEAGIADALEVDSAPELIRTISVSMEKDGTLQRAIEGCREVRDKESGGFQYFTSRNLPWASLVWEVDTDSKERAIKVVNEKRAIILANNLWDKTNETREFFRGKESHEMR